MYRYIEPRNINRSKCQNLNTALPGFCKFEKFFGLRKECHNKIEECKRVQSVFFKSRFTLVTGTRNFSEQTELHTLSSWAATYSSGVVELQVSCGIQNAYFFNALVIWRQKSYKLQKPELCIMSISPSFLPAWTPNL